MTKTLSLGEIKFVEETTGYNFQDDSQPLGNRMIALVVVLKMREVKEQRKAGKTVPDFTLEDAYEMDVSEAEEICNQFMAAVQAAPKLT